LAAASPVRVEPGARERIRASNVATGRRIAILDDDATGSQTVHDVSTASVSILTNTPSSLGPLC
jgi:hypothetical protein